MAQEKDQTQNEQKKRSFVREHIVPRKNTKRIILTVLSTIGLALLFGAIAGVAFFVSQDILDGNSVTEAPPTVSISRDESRPDNTSAFFPETTTARDPESDQAGSGPDERETESGEIFPGGETERIPTEYPGADDTESTTEDSGEGTEGRETTAPEETSDGAETPENTQTETPEETEKETAAPTILDVYKQIRTGFVSIMISIPEGTDIFGTPVYKTLNTFGTVVTESEENYYVLFDGSMLIDGSLVTPHIDTAVLDSELLGRDALTGLSVISVPKSEQNSSLTVIPLGNSNLTLTAETVYQFGYQMGDFIAMDQGVVSYVSAYENFIDGYRMMIYTGMQRREGTFSILVNQSGEIIGLIGDKVSMGGTMAAARGISSIKYLIDDLCSGRDTAYIGLKGRAVGSEEAASSGRSAGFYIQELDENGPAYRSGLQPGDRIITLNEQAIPHSFGLQLQIDDLEPGSEIRIQIARLGSDGREMILLYRFIAEAR
ncbi:MAG: PDZ domain-containing protein [Lachnospiraceae bacterium]|nr:PDZ domain-containing protein [Lachnospiraceae bacterium]